jgi:hypothetical protein
VLDVQNFPIQNQWYIGYLAGKQLSVIAQTFLEYVILMGPGRRSEQEGDKGQLATSN